jgi:hypothetical protein
MPARPGHGRAAVSKCAWLQCGGQAPPPVPCIRERGTGDGGSRSLPVVASDWRYGTSWRSDNQAAGSSPPATRRYPKCHPDREGGTCAGGRHQACRPSSRCRDASNVTCHGSAVWVCGGQAPSPVPPGSACSMLLSCCFTASVILFTASLILFTAMIHPVRGVIDPVRGVIDPVRGVIDPALGTIDPALGTIDPVRGTIDPALGAIHPVRGVIDPVRGAIHPAGGMIDPVARHVTSCSRLG